MLISTKISFCRHPWMSFYSVYVCPILLDMFSLFILSCIAWKWQMFLSPPFPFLLSVLFEIYKFPFVFLKIYHFHVPSLCVFMNITGSSLLVRLRNYSLYVWNTFESHQPNTSWELRFYGTCCWTIRFLTFSRLTMLCLRCMGYHRWCCLHWCFGYELICWNHVPEMLPYGRGKLSCNLIQQCPFLSSRTA